MAFSPIKWLLAFASRLRFPQLFLLTAAVFVADVLIPDVLPFVDEVLLGLLTALFASFRKRKDKEPEEPENRNI
ncbi:MAG: hypothetical protein HKO64_05675 [Xanthomonadales bacterium]|nr:hypothetical protein [Xanthomonadales bacterium]NNL95092.1 hypothetical protein [Xanthomonadales bacterium]